MEGFAYIPDPGDGPKLAGRNTGVIAEKAGKVRLGGKAELIGHLAKTHIAIDCSENGLLQSHNIQKDARAYAGRGFEHTEEIGAAHACLCRQSLDIVATSPGSRRIMAMAFRTRQSTDCTRDASRSPAPTLRHSVKRFDHGDHQVTEQFLVLYDIRRRNGSWTWPAPSTICGCLALWHLWRMRKNPVSP